MPEKIRKKTLKKHRTLLCFGCRTKNRCNYSLPKEHRIIYKWFPISHPFRVIKTESGCRNHIHSKKCRSKQPIYIDNMYEDQIYYTICYKYKVLEQLLFLHTPPPPAPI